MTPKFTDNETLGRFLGDATPVQPEELRAAYQRIEELTAALRKIAEGTTDQVPPYRAIDRHQMKQIASDVLQEPTFPGDGAYSL